MRSHHRFWRLVLLMLMTAVSGAAEAQKAAPLPPGVRPVWDLARAARESTPTRERICINGLWRWQPAQDPVETVPAAGWGYFKVPGCWPGITDYMQKDSQTVFAHPDWNKAPLAAVTAAWYQREITIPAGWANRRITLTADYLNSFATVYVDGRKVGELRFPAGEVDISSLCRPGSAHTLSLRVEALPLSAIMLSYTDTASARQVKGAVERRGLCGDVYLVSAPNGPRLADVKVDTSVRRWEITFRAGVQNLTPNARYTLRARILDRGRTVGTFTSRPFQGADVTGDQTAFTGRWKPTKLWDTHTPQNLYLADVALADAGGKILDAALPAQFGFREFWIQGRDFYLNGSRIFLSAVPIDNAQISAGMATYRAVRETLQRLKTFGVNLVYTHNYDCQPGAHLSFEETLRAADDEGMLVALSQPHFSHYQWQAADAEKANGYVRHAAFYVQVAANHPSVVFYAMSHNATSFTEDANPDMIDGIQDIRPDWARKSIQPALRAEAIVKGLDPGRIVYHHSSGNLSAMDTLNFYLNFTPIQEVSDWFQHWASVGVKPLFTCEYGVPISWDWTMYRGWYQGKREFGSAPVPWEFCLAEWNAQFFGDRAYKISDWEKDNLRWEAQKFRAGAVWHRWDYPHDVGAHFEERYPVTAMYMTDNLRAFRALGLSANNTWDFGDYWELRPGVDRGRKERKVDWDNLQRPGYSPDYVDGRMEWMNVAYERSDWKPTVAAQALIRNNGPLLAYLGGKPAAVTSKDHLFLPGETVEKQMIVINNSRRTVRCDCTWSLPLPSPIRGAKTLEIETGQQVRIPLALRLPGGTPSGAYTLKLSVTFSSGETQEDTLILHVLPIPPVLKVNAKIALFDPGGETARWLTAMGVRFQPVTADADLSAYDLLLVGKAALTVTGAAPDITRVRAGLKVILFEQTAEVLEKRFGFRVEEYGLRWVFPRVPDHPALAGIATEHLRDWRGEATLLPSRLKYEIGPRYAPMVEWCGIPVTRAWRAGNRGNVASVLIEKPARGDFMPILDGGYSLQYSPLIEFHEGRGLVLFCQMDVTGRTEADPAADTLARNLLNYATAWKPAPIRKAVYVGEPAGTAHLEAAGFSPGTYQGETLSADQVLIVGSGGGRTLAAHADAIADFLKAGGNLLAVGLDEPDANAFLPTPVHMKQAEHIAAFFEPFGKSSAFAGVSPADVHNRDPHTFPLVTGGATVIGDGILAKAEKANMVLFQFAPYHIGAAAGNSVASTAANLNSEPGHPRYNLRRTYRRVSFTLTRLLANMGVSSSTPILARFHTPVLDPKTEKRWLEGLYLDTPEEWDDPYRFFGW